MDVNKVKQVREKIDTLQETVALLAKSMAARQPNTPKKRRRKVSRHQVVEDSSDEEGETQVLSKKEKRTMVAAIKSEDYATLPYPM